MKIVKGNKTSELSNDELNNIISKHNQVVMDLGTGDGRLVYKSALRQTDTLFIGIDPAPKQMEEFSKKALKKKLENIIFALGSVEILPRELVGKATKVSIILPWGSLLKTIVNPDEKTMLGLASLLKKEGKLEIVFGFDELLEPNETQRLELNKIDKLGIDVKTLNLYKIYDLYLENFREINSTDLKNLDSTWAKRLSQQTKRPMFFMEFTKH